MNSSHTRSPGISRINEGVDVLWCDTRKKIRKPEPAWRRGPQDQFTILRAETDLGAGPQPNLLSQAEWNPHAKVVSPLLNLRLHDPSGGSDRSAEQEGLRVRVHCILLLDSVPLQVSIWPASKNKAAHGVQWVHEFESRA